MAERNCDKCVYGRRSGNCTAWNCKGTVTVEDIKAEARQSAIDEYHDKLSKEMHDLWRFYKADTNNRPKPDFMCAYSMVDLIAEQLKKGENNV